MLPKEPSNNKQNASPSHLLAGIPSIYKLFFQSFPFPSPLTIWERRAPFFLPPYIPYQVTDKEPPVSFFPPHCSPCMDLACRKSGSVKCKKPLWGGWAPAVSSSSVVLKMRWYSVFLGLHGCRLWENRNISQDLITLAYYFIINRP